MEKLFVFIFFINIFDCKQSKRRKYIKKKYKIECETMNIWNGAIILKKMYYTFAGVSYTYWLFADLTFISSVSAVLSWKRQATWGKGHGVYLFWRNLVPFWQLFCTVCWTVPAGRQRGEYGLLLVLQSQRRPCIAIVFAASPDLFCWIASSQALSVCRLAKQLLWIMMMANLAPYRETATHPRLLCCVD